MRAIFLFPVLLTFMLEASTQVVFDDEPEPFPQRQFQFQRPQRPNGFGFGGNQNGNGFQNPSGFGNQNGNGFQNPSGFGNQNGNGFQNPSGFGNQNGNNGFQNQNPNANSNNFQTNNFRNQNNKAVDCQTFENTDGFCTPLPACGRIARILQNRPPLVAARILRRSICGFSNILPNVCCPSGRAQQQFHSQELNNNNNFNNDGFKNDKKNQNPGGAGMNGGNGLVIIPPAQIQTTLPTTPPTTTTTSTTSTTPFPTQAVSKQPIKKPVDPSSSGGLIIGDGPIALLPPQTGASSPTLGYSDEGLPNDCGFSNATHTRIVGGRIAEKGAWPWIAALGYKEDNGQINYLCGGALISPNYVVTASHCLHGRDDLANVRLGDYDIYSTSDGVTPLDVEVEKKILHPNYDPNTFKNDIALLKLKQSVPFSRQIHPICLPSTPQLRNQRFENTSPFVAGWGAIQFNGPSSSVLREVQIPTVPDSVCQEKYATFKSAVVDNTNICAGLQAGGKDACQGDSGGPLQQPVGSDRFVLTGIVSFGFKCAEPGFPGVYTRVTSHLDWLQSTTNQRL